MGFKVEKRPAEGQPGKKQAGPLAYGLAFLFLLTVAWGLQQWVYPQFDPCPACQGFGTLSCGAPGCEHGRVPCTGGCLKKDSPGWEHMDVEGHPPSDIWMRFYHDGGGWSAWNQNHIGHSIEKINGTWQDTGVCKLCQGTGLMPCPICHAQKFCERCDGSGRLRRWLWPL